MPDTKAWWLWCERSIRHFPTPSGSRFADPLRGRTLQWMTNSPSTLHKDRYGKGDGQSKAVYCEPAQDEPADRCGTGLHGGGGCDAATARIAGLHIIWTGVVCAAFSRGD